MYDSCFVFLSLQQFVKGCGNFAMEMADAILNSLTNGRHMKFVESLKKDNDKNTSDGKVCVLIVISLINRLEV